MTKAAIVILAGTDGHENLGRLVTGLETAREFVQAGDEVEVVLDGAGTQWVEELEDPENDDHDLYRAVKDDVGVCEYCAGAFGADAAVEDAGLVTFDDHDGHPSIRSLVADGYEVITYRPAPRARGPRAHHLLTGGSRPLVQFERNPGESERRRLRTRRSSRRRRRTATP